MQPKVVPFNPVIPAELSQMKTLDALVKKLPENSKENKDKDN